MTSGREIVARIKARKNKENKEKDAALRAALGKVTPGESRRIRESYDKAMEGLRALALVLELADANLDEPAGPLIVAHLEVCGALDAVDKSRLGDVLSEEIVFTILD